MIIQTISLNGIFGRWREYHTFQKITDDDGNVIEYIHNSKDGLTEENVREAYKNLLKSGREMKRKLDIENITIDDYIAKLDKSIDKYYMYIDNGRQYDEAVKHNKKIEKKIEQYEALKENGVK